MAAATPKKAPAKKPAAKPAAKTPKVEPTLVEVKVSRSYGLKVNLGNYESADTHVSEAETWDVTGLVEADVDALVKDRSEALEGKMFDALLANGEKLMQMAND